MEATIDEIVRASSMPLSIIIVGVGEEDFTSMDLLDADEEPLFSRRYNKKMDRDIVQFVPFREFRNNPIELARQTLDEVPRQLISFMESKSIKPLPQQNKRKIQKQLTKSKKDYDEETETPEYFLTKQQEFIE